MFNQKVDLKDDEVVNLQKNEPLSVEKYNGLYDSYSIYLYNTLRNLYSLSKRSEICVLITHILNFQIYQQQKRHSPNFNPDEDKQFFVPDSVKQLLEDSINLVSEQVSSPIAKVLAYEQITKMIIKDYEELEGDERQDKMLNLILNIRHNHTIENLFIDIQMIREFIPEEQMYREQYIPLTNIFGALQLILADGNINQQQMPMPMVVN